ncbi:unnamed protein product [Adineta steineri]|uniref:Uncharacterized protein n=1 Tax=Adineta steineri TaxID=433720 RepID=A0A814AZH3_9BILA|nr:unnamed protein product [Adineta steineri]CAF0919813.1 unnamed protein product [Adineta steineri]
MVGVSLITGAARGMGRAIALRLAKDGFNVAINDLEASSVELEKVVVANAGICKLQPLISMSEENWDRVFAVNMRGVFLCYREAAKIMIKQGTGGRIIGACSSAGYTGYPLLSHYCATKWGVRGLTQSAAMELAAHKITVNTYCPGFIETPLTDGTNKEFAELRGKTIEEVKKDFVNGIPLRRTGLPNDVANLVSFLASKQADYITGQNILVNGGLVLS